MDPKPPFLLRRHLPSRLGGAPEPTGSTAPAPGPADARAPFRWWMTGSFAVAMAALLPLRDLDTRQNAVRLLRQSRYDAIETVVRIEQAAAAAGWGVLARVGGERPLLVLSDEAGGTPVLMATAESEPVLPLGLVVRPNPDGAAVLVSAAAADGWAAAIDVRARTDAETLPELLRRALG